MAVMIACKQYFSFLNIVVICMLVLSVVEKILEEKVDKETGTRLYLVQWKKESKRKDRREQQDDSDFQESSWEPESNILDPTLIEEFKKNQGAAKHHQGSSSNNNNQLSENHQPASPTLAEDDEDIVVQVDIDELPSQQNLPQTSDVPVQASKDESSSSRFLDINYWDEDDDESDGEYNENGNEQEDEEDEEDEFEEEDDDEEDDKEENTQAVEEIQSNSKKRKLDIPEFDHSKRIQFSEHRMESPIQGVYVEIPTLESPCTYSPTFIPSQSTASSKTHPLSVNQPVHINNNNNNGNNSDPSNLHSLVHQFYCELKGHFEGEDQSANYRGYPASDYLKQEMYKERIRLLQYENDLLKKNVNFLKGHIQSMLSKRPSIVESETTSSNGSSSITSSMSSASFISE